MTDRGTNIPLSLFGACVCKLQSHPQQLLGICTASVQPRQQPSWHMALSHATHVQPHIMGIMDRPFLLPFQWVFSSKVGCRAEASDHGHNAAFAAQTRSNCSPKLS